MPFKIIYDMYRNGNMYKSILPKFFLHMFFTNHDPLELQVPVFLLRSLLGNLFFVALQFSLSLPLFPGAPKKTTCKKCEWSKTSPTLAEEMCVA